MHPASPGQWPFRTGWKAAWLFKREQHQIRALPTLSHFAKSLLVSFGAELFVSPVAGKFALQFVELG